ncbi:MAG: TetR/AcrR family transcriptional regulator [Proteobacteria bacterium]|nr:TetR/AcrR family transcriptional regulator [Pseudomonadota bacterium]
MINTKYKARKPVQKRGIITRKKIIDAAVDEFTEKGYHNTNAMAIAIKAGVATGTFYSYFNDKKDIMIEIIKVIYADLSKKTLVDFQVTVSDNAMENYKECRRVVQYMIDIFHTAYVERPRLFEQIYAMVILDKDIYQVNREERHKIFTQLMFNLKDYADYIKVKDIETASRLLFISGDEIVRSIQLLSKEDDRKKMLNEFVAMACKYLMLPEE